MSTRVRRSAASIIIPLALGVSIAAFAPIFGRLAAEQAIDLDAIKSQLINNYMVAAFARGNELIRPVGIPTVSYYCPGEYCSNLVMRLKSDLPNYVTQNEATTENSDADVEVIIYPSVAAANESKTNYVGQAGEKAEVLNMVECRLGRLTRGMQVTKVIITVVVVDDERANEACVLREIIRGTGLDFVDTYRDYKTRYSNETDQIFERDVVRSVNNFMMMHWAAPTSPGMGRVQVKKILENFVKSVRR